MSGGRIRGLFVASTPLQYLNALEARHAWGLASEASALLLVPKSLAEILQRLEALVVPADWGLVETIVYPGFWVPRSSGGLVSQARKEISQCMRARAFVRRVARLMARIGPLDLVAIGNFTTRTQRHIVAVAPAREVIVLDDGTSTPEHVLPHRADPNDPRPTRGRFSARDRYGRWLRRVSGMTWSQPPSATFFTMYGITPPPGDRVVANRYNLHKGRLHACTEAAPVWFVGACHVEVGEAHQAGFFDVMRRVRAYYGALPVAYLPHHYEAADKLQRLVELGFTIEHLGMAIEPWILAHRAVPGRLGAIASTVVDSLSTLLDGRIPTTVFDPDDAYFKTAAARDKIRTIIANHARNPYGNIEVVPVPLRQAATAC